MFMNKKLGKEFYKGGIDMPFPLDPSVKETIIKHFKKKKIDFDEISLINVLKTSNKKFDIYWAVIGLRDVGTEKCIPYLKDLKDFPMQDVKDCILLTIAHIAGAKETEFYVSVLEEKGTRKDYPMWAVKDCGDERAIEPVIEFIEYAYKKIKQPKSSYTSCAYMDGLVYLSKYYDMDTRVKDIFDKFINIKDKLPEGVKNTLSKEVSFFYGKLL
jgi:hypothetical protein